MYTDRIIAWNTFFNDLIDGLYGESYGLNDNLKYKVNKNDEEYILEIALPGYDKEDIILNIEEGILNISYRKTEKEISNWKNTFNQSFKIKRHIDINKIDAYMDKGILFIKFPIEKDKKKKLLSIK